MCFDHDDSLIKIGVVFVLYRVFVSCVGLNTAKIDDLLAFSSGEKWFGLIKRQRNCWNLEIKIQKEDLFVKCVVILWFVGLWVFCRWWLCYSANCGRWLRIMYTITIRTAANTPNGFVLKSSMATVYLCWIGRKPPRTSFSGQQLTHAVTLALDYRIKARKSAMLI